MKNDQKIVSLIDVLSFFHPFYSCSADPGGIRTELTRNVFGISWVIVKFLLNPFLLYPPWMGALTQLYAATSPSEDASLGGKFYIPWSRVGGMPKAAEDIKAQDDRECSKR